MMADAKGAYLAAEGLPAEVTSFIGRRAELRQMREALSTSRLVTVTGFGGVGKTRAAVRLASELHRAFPNGVKFVELDAVNDPDWVAEYVVEALGLQGRSTSPALVSVVEYFADRHALLVMDNCEHVIDSAAILVDTLLRTCPKVRVLATSREPLRVEGETVLPLAPLDIQTHKDDWSESMILFLDRARAQVPDFEVRDDSREVLSSICRKLEGIPLAIELAAGRIRAMSPREIDGNLTDRWTLLTRGSRTASRRQQTMAACIEWSFALCDELERDLWAEISVFADGFESDAVEAVCSVGAHGTRMEILASLVDKSIVIADSAGEITRFRLLPPIRARGIVHLREAGQIRRVRRSHRDWCADLTRRANEEWISSRQLTWMNRLRRESSNIRAALEFCATEPGEAEAGLVIGASLVEFAISEGLYRQGRYWSDVLLELAPDPTVARAMALRASCWWAAFQGDLEHAARLAEQEGQLAAKLGGSLPSLHQQTKGLLALLSGELDEAERQLLGALPGQRQAGDLAQVAMTLCLLGLNYTFMGRPDAALSAHEECLAITEPVGEYRFRSYSLWIAGLAAWVMGDREAARSLQEQSMQLKRVLNEPMGLGLSMEAMAWLDAELEPRRAAALLGAAANHWARIGTSTDQVPGLRTHHERCETRLRATMGDPGFVGEFESGRSLTAAQAVSYALRERADAPSDDERQGLRRPGPALLTRRELEIAGLIREGLTNREIAERLVISKRTAETHVEHILTKLGATRRQQIVNWLDVQGSA